MSNDRHLSRPASRLLSSEFGGVKMQDLDERIVVKRPRVRDAPRRLGTGPADPREGFIDRYAKLEEREPCHPTRTVHARMARHKDPLPLANEVSYTPARAKRRLDLVGARLSIVERYVKHVDRASERLRGRLVLDRAERHRVELDGLGYVRRRALPEACSARPFRDFIPLVKRLHGL